MMRYFKLIKPILLSVFAVLMVACSPPLDYTQELHYKIHKFYHYAEARLKPDFKRAGLPYPPRQIALLAFKHERKMQLWARNNIQDRWHYIKTFHIFAASGGPGPKLREGDRQVPEGVYQIVGLNPRSRFDLSMHVNYPNSFDRYHASLDGRTHLGGDIFIHGNRRSIGCMAIGNNNIQQLFVLADLVGIKNITVIIAPNDLRYEKPLRSREHVKWLPQLYDEIREALAPFKGHRA